jgi:hypothetical protein
MSDDFDALYQPYWIAIGKVSYAWNSLHESLGLLFCCVVGAVMKSDLVEAPLEIWNEQNNDRTARKMLWAVASKAFGSEDTRLRDIKWLLDKTNSLALKRNTTIHSPLALEATRKLGERVKISANHMMGHRLAQNLKEIDLLAEFESYYKKLLSLDSFALDAAQSLANSSETFPWPVRPNSEGIKTSKSEA